MQRTVGLAPAARLDYAQVVDGETLEPVAKVQRGNVALIAVHVGKVRLIDNLIL
jgi:pantoate--beta-alanine ligase